MNRFLLTLTSVTITNSELHTIYIELLLPLVPVKPLCEIMIEYLKCVIQKGLSYYDMHKYHRQFDLTRIDQFWGDTNDLRQILKLDLVSEIEITQDGNQGGAFYRCFFRVKQCCWFRKHSEKKLLMPTTAYQIVPMGSPDEPWPLPEMGGPTILEMCRNKSIYRLSNGVLFDCVPDYYQVTFIRRS